MLIQWMTIWGVGSPRTDVTRYNALAAMPGLDVKAFDGRSVLGESLWQKRVNHRLYLGQSVRRANSALIETVKETNPDYVIVDGEHWLYPSTLKTIKHHTGALIYYGTDDALARPSVLWLHRLGARYFDLYLTTNRLNIRELPDRYGVPAIGSAWVMTAITIRNLSRTRTSVMPRIFDDLRRA